MKGFRFLRSGLFWKIHASYSAVILVTGGLIGFLVDQNLEHSSRRSLERHLRDSCSFLTALAGGALQGGADPELAAAVGQMGADTGIRVTWVREDGRVIADSSEDPALMDDHHDRPEIVAARTDGFGITERFSHTVRLPMLYVAKRIEREGVLVGYVRCSLPLRDLEERLGARRFVFLGILAGLAVALVLGFLVTRFIARPIGEFAAAAEKMGAGDYETRLETGRSDEFGILANSFNRLGSEITRRIAATSREEAQLKAMLAAMVEGVLAVDDRDRVTFCNGAARRLLRIQTDPLGRTLWELAPVTELAELLSEARNQRGVSRREFEWYRSGREQVIDATASPFEGGGQGGTVVVLNDISDLRRLERIRRDFVANVSHELKTPLTAIRGFVETLLDGAFEEEGTSERFLRRIEANVDRLTNLVKDLLSLARIESQQDDISRVPIDWRAIIQDVEARHEEGLRAKKQELSIDGEPSCQVVGDPEAMTQVLDNLLDNAIKYSDGPGTIRLTLERVGERGVLRVADDGVGIPPADLGRIFERFYRVDKARSREVGGTGLGLSIVKNLLLSMGGVVSVESQLGEGTTFSVELPLAPQD